MQRFLLRLLVTALAVLLASAIFPDQISAQGDDTTRLIAVTLFAFVLGLLNAFLRPILLLLTLPLNLLTLGLFTLVVNALVFWIASLIPVGVDVNGFGGAFLGALVVSVVSFFASRAFR